MQQRRIDGQFETFSWILLILLISVLYLAVSIAVSDLLVHSYEPLSCTVVNSSVVEKHGCPQYGFHSVYEAKWVLMIHRNDSRSTDYLGDIRVRAPNYYIAFETIQSSYVVCRNRYKDNRSAGELFSRSARI